MNFELRFPTEIIFGRDTIDQIGVRAKKYGEKALLVTGRASMRRSGIVDKVISLLRAEGVNDVHVYDQVEHDPSIETVDRGTELAKQKGCDMVIGLGGGSALDTAKTIACLVTNEGSAYEYLYGKPLKNPGIPFIAVPTTAGTGAEITKNSVITDVKNKVKQSIRSELMIAKVAIVDPVLTISMPPEVTAATGMDALTQAIEVCVSLATNPVAETLGLRSISLITENIVKAYQNGQDMDARENMALGSLICAMAFANAGLGAVHALAHPIGAMFGVAHGVICALLLPHVMKFNIPVKTEQFIKIAHAMGLRAETEQELPSKAVEHINKLLSELNIPQRLSEIGITARDIPLIARSTRGSSLNNNPRKASPEDLEQILLGAL